MKYSQKREPSTELRPKQAILAKLAPPQAIHAGQALRLVFYIMKSQRVTAYRIVSAPTLSGGF